MKKRSEKSKKTKTTRKSKKSLTKKEIEEALLNNFISLQKVLTNLSLKFEELSNNISKLLKLFEISAKTFAERYPQGKGDIDKEFLEKLDALLEQNKLISKGITLMEEKIRERLQRPSPPLPPPRPPLSNQPLRSVDNYQKSLRNTS